MSRFNWDTGKDAQINHLFLSVAKTRTEKLKVAAWHFERAKRGKFDTAYAWCLFILSDPHCGTLGQHGALPPEPGRGCWGTAGCTFQTWQCSKWELPQSCPHLEYGELLHGLASAKSFSSHPDTENNSLQKLYIKELDKRGFCQMLISISHFYFKKLLFQPLAWLEWYGQWENTLCLVKLQCKYIRDILGMQKPDKARILWILKVAPDQISFTDVRLLKHSPSKSRSDGLDAPFSTCRLFFWVCSLRLLFWHMCEQLVCQTKHWPKKVISEW